MTKEEFIEVITKCQSGDKNAIGSIYEEYFGKMCVTAFGIVKERDSAYDIASNVILKLLEMKYCVLKIDNPVGYMFRMVHNEAINYVVKRDHEVSVPEIPEVKNNGIPGMLWLEDILAVLTEKERELFILHIVWDMTLSKAAKYLGIKYDTVKSRYKIIRAKIKNVYKK